MLLHYATRNERCPSTLEEKRKKRGDIKAKYGLFMLDSVCVFMRVLLWSGRYQAKYGDWMHDYNEDDFANCLVKENCDGKYDPVQTCVAANNFFCLPNMQWRFIK